MNKKKGFQANRVLSYFKAEWVTLAAVTVSGLIYNIGLLAAPWFEGRMAGRLVDILGGSVECDAPVSLPGRDWEHRLAVIAKIAPTPEKYPRRAGKPEKKPL